MNNKYQDALNSLNPNYIGEQEYSWRKADEILQELVDKETPMKVTNIHVDEWYCPNCFQEIGTSSHYKRCPECGQKLDWSNENE